MLTQDERVRIAQMVKDLEVMSRYANDALESKARHFSADAKVAPTDVLLAKLLVTSQEANNIATALDALRKI